MTPVEQVVVLLAGLGSGILTSTVGVASLLSFPVLVAVGLPPVVANASNTVGLTPGCGLPVGSNHFHKIIKRMSSPHTHPFQLKQVGG